VSVLSATLVLTISEFATVPPQNPEVSGLTFCACAEALQKTAIGKINA